MSISIHSEATPLGIQDAVSEAERLLAGRRSSVPTLRLSRQHAIPTSRRSSMDPRKRLSGLDIDLHDLKHLMLLDAELERDEEQFALLKKQQPSDLDPERCRDVLRRMRLLIIIAALGGFLSGYNTGVLSGVLLPLTQVFDLSAEQKEIIVSSTILFAFLASIYGGKLNQTFGRRPTILGAAAVFCLGALVLMFAQNFEMLVAGEILLGIGIGVESLTSPMYIAEVAKPSIRGMLVSAYALLMCLGQFVAGIVDGLLAPFPNGWRFMLGFAVVPGTIMFVGFWNLPESPSWLVANGRHVEAEDIFKSIRDTDEEVEVELVEIHKSIRLSTSDDEHESTTLALFWNMIRDKATRRALIVGCSLMVLQQWCGVNAVLYYAASIYEMAGFNQLTSIWLSAFTSLAQIFGLGLSVFLVESAGRRPLILSSLAFVTVSVIGLGFSFYLARVDSNVVVSSGQGCESQPAWGWSGQTQYCFDCTKISGCVFCDGMCIPGDANQCPDPSLYSDSCTNPYGYVSVIFMVVFLITFGIGLAGLPWTVNSEIYPIKYRSLAVSLSTATNWLCNLIVSSSFLTLSNRLMAHRAFWLYGLLSGMGWIWLYCMLPETKGKALEELNAEFGGFRNDNRTNGKSSSQHYDGTTQMTEPVEPHITTYDAMG